MFVGTRSAACRVTMHLKYSEGGLRTDAGLEGGSAP
jgi:hypothetical protein